MNTTNYWSDPYGGTVAGTTDITITPTDGSAGGANTQTITITFGKAVTNPVLHIDRIGGTSGTAVATSVWNLSGFTATSGSVTLSKLSGNNAFLVSSTSFQRAIAGAPANNGLVECNSTTTDNGSTACGTVQVTGTGITQLSFTVTFSGTTGDALEFKVGIPDTKVIYAKKSIGGTNNFTFAGTNGVGGSTLNTGTANPASSTTYTLTSNTANTTITETAVTGYALTGTSCVDQGGNAITSSLSGLVLTVPATSITSVSGQTITCTFTNTRATVAVQKNSAGGIGTFGFSASSNLASTPGAITTLAAGTATPASPTAINVTTLGTAVTVTESAVAGYTLTGFACTDANSAVTGNTGSFGTFSGNIGTIPATNIKAGAALTCVFTNTKTPTFKVQKVSQGGTGTFAFSASANLAATPTAITTVTAGTAAPAAPTATNISSIGTAVTLTESAVAGYALTGVSCTDANSAITGNTGTFGSFSGNTLTVAAGNIKAGADLTCVLTNTKLPTLTLTKISNGGVGGFTFTGTNGWASQTINTVTSGTGVSGAAQTLTAASTATTITETIPSGYAVTAISCSGLGSGGTATPNLAGGSVTLDAAAVAAGANIACTFTNAKKPTLTLTKISNGGVGGFTFTGTNGWASQTITTVTSGTGVSGAAQTLTAASTATTITEAIPSGYAVTAISCSGLGSGGTATPNLAGGSVALDAAAVAAGANIACTFTNAKLPTLTLTKISNGGVGGFTFTGTNGWTSQTITTVTSGTGVTGAAQTLAAASTATAITETVPSGYIVAAISCTGLGAGGAATPNLAGGSVALDAAALAAGSNIACTFTNAKLPTLTLTKISNGGVGSFTFTGTNGWTSQTITTVTSGAGVTGATQALTASTATTITETVPSGYIVTAISCTGLGSGGTATPNLAGGSVALDAAAMAVGSNIACTFTNAKLPTLTLTKISNGGVGSFTFTGTNGWTSQTITTLTSGTGVAGAVQTLTAASTATTITEVLPSGYAMMAVTCSGMGAGGSIATDLAGANFTLNTAATAAGSAISCTVTNAKLPTFQVVKTSLGGVRGFGFWGNYGLPAHTVTTVTAGVPAAGTVYTLNSGAISGGELLHEAVPAGWVMTAANCTGLGAGGTQSVDLPGGMIQLNAAATAAGTAIVCNITDSKLPTVALTKISTGGVGSFTFTGTNGWVSQTFTTVSPGVGATGAAQTLSAVSTATTLTEALGTSFIMTGLSCSGLGAGGSATPSLSAGTITFDAAATAPGAAITCTVTNAAAAPAVAVAKTASPTSVSAAGAAITYTIAVSNTGNVPVSAITLSDPRGSVTCPTSGAATIATLAVGASENCSLTYVATQADFDGNGGGDGDIDNTATASGTYASAPVSGSGSAAVTLALNPKLVIAKDGSPKTGLKAGDIVTYTYTVENQGNVTIDNVRINDVHHGYGTAPVAGGEALVGPPGHGSTDGALNGSWDHLAPGDTVTFTATYQVTQQDVDLLQ